MPKFKLFKCEGRVRQLQRKKKPGLTNIKGSRNALENHIRRRIAPIKRSYQDKNGKHWQQKYGPLFGGKTQAIDRSCDGTSGKGALGYAAHTGTNEDIIYFKRLYGGVRQLGNNCDSQPECPCKEQKFVNNKPEDKCS